MPRLYHPVVVCAFVALVALPVGARVAHIRDYALNGVFQPVEYPEPSFAALRDESYQHKLTAWFERNLGLHGYEVISDNTLLMHLFRETRVGSPVVLGERDVLFIDEDLSYFNKDWSRWDQAKLDALVTRLAAIQSKLAAQHRTLIPLIIPSKTTVYRDAVRPSQTRAFGDVRATDVQLYGELVRALDAHHVVYVDGRALLSDPRLPRDLVWAKTGRHWTRYGACLALQQVIERFRELTGVAVDYGCKPATRSIFARTDDDFDLRRLSNTLWVRHPSNAVVSDHDAPPADAPKPTVMFVGTSFCWGLVRDARASERFGSVSFNSYDTLFYGTNVVGQPIDVNNPAWVEQLRHVDLFVLDLFETYLAADNAYYDRFTTELAAAIGVP